MHLIVLEGTSILITAGKDAFTFYSQVILPDTLEDASVRPRHHSVSISLACFEVSLIFGLLELWALLHCVGQAIVVLHYTMTIGSAIFKGAVVLVSILVINFCEPVQSTVVEGTWLYDITRILFFLLFDVSAAARRSVLFVLGGRVLCRS